MFKKINLLVLVFLLTGMYQAIAKNINNSPENNTKVEISILTNFLSEQGYRKLGDKEFRQRCLDYFGIDINSTNDDYFQCIDGVSGCYNISVKQNFLSTFGESIFYEPNDPETPTIKEVKARLRQKNNELAMQFIAYNKLLFNDEASVTSFFLKKDSIDFLWEIVFIFDYEKNETLYQAALPNIATTINQISTNQHLLFYNNQQRGYKKRLLNDLYIERGIVGIEKIIDATYNNWEKFRTDLYRTRNGVDEKITINQPLQDRALLHLIKLISYHQDTKQPQEKSQQLAYSYLVKFMDKDNGLEKRLKQTNYYDLGLVVLPQEKRIISEKKNEILKNHYITKSIDGYVNLRKSPKKESEIIKKIQNNVNLVVLDYDGTWYHVKLIDDKNIGYIHQSQLIYKSETD